MLPGSSALLGNRKVPHLIAPWYENVSGLYLCALKHAKPVAKRLPEREPGTQECLVSLSDQFLPALLGAFLDVRRPLACVLLIWLKHACIPPVKAFW
jgi:hypothetical protein